LDAHAKKLLTTSKGTHRVLRYVLGAPVLDKPFLLYIYTPLVRDELNNSPSERMWLALMFAVQKLRHYIQAYTVYIIFKADLVKYILSSPILNG